MQSSLRIYHTLLILQSWLIRSIFPLLCFNCFRPTPTPSNRLRVSRGGGSGGGGGVATPLRESASFELGGDVGRGGLPRGGDSSATTSPGSSSLARASIDSESDRDDGEGECGGFSEKMHFL